MNSILNAITSARGIDANAISGLCKSTHIPVCSKSWRGNTARLLAVSVALIVMSGCSGLKPQLKARNPLLEETVKSSDGKTVTYLDEKAAAFVKAYTDARASPKDQNLIAAYVESGITYTELLCKAYFDKIAENQSQLSYTKKEVGLVGGLASTILGLASASTAALATTGAAFSFGSASLDAYNDMVVIAPDLATLEGLVRARQAQVEINIHQRLQAPEYSRWPHRIETLDQAERALTEYIYPCTINGIRSLLDNSLRKKTTEISRELQGQDNQTAAPEAPARAPAPLPVPAPVPPALPRVEGKPAAPGVNVDQGISQRIYPSIE